MSKIINNTAPTGVVSRGPSLPRKPTSEEIRAFAKQIQKMKERDSELIVGIFENRECPGQAVNFNIKLYPGEDFVSYRLEDGQRYQIPRGVARHLNNNCFYTEYKHLQGDSPIDGGHPVQMALPVNDGRRPNAERYQARRKIHRYAFRSLEYLDEDMSPVDIVEVTKAV